MPARTIGGPSGDTLDAGKVAEAPRYSGAWAGPW